VAHPPLHTQHVRLPRLRILLHHREHHPRLVPQVREISEGDRNSACFTMAMPSSPTVLPLRRDGDGDCDNRHISGPRWGAVESVIGAISSMSLGGVWVNSGSDSTPRVGVIEVQDDVPDEYYDASQATWYQERCHCCCVCYHTAIIKSD